MWVEKREMHIFSIIVINDYWDVCVVAMSSLLCHDKLHRSKIDVKHFKNRFVMKVIMF